MLKVLNTLAAFIFMVNGAFAANRLADNHLDAVTAGWASAHAAAEGVVGGNSTVVTTTATLAQITQFATGTLLWNVVSAPQSPPITLIAVPISPACCVEP